MLRHTLLCALAALALIGAGPASATELYQYHVAIDTSGYTGTGWLDLQLNPGLATVPAATAKLSNFSGVLDSGYAPMLSGDVSGSLPGVVSFGNSTAYNDLFQAVVLGGLLQMDLAFGLTTPSLDGTAFAVALYGSDQMSALGLGDPFTNSLVTFDLRRDVTALISDAAMVSAKEIPEPSGMLVLLTGLCALALLRRRQV